MTEGTSKSAQESPAPKGREAKKAATATTKGKLKLKSKSSKGNASSNKIGTRGKVRWEAVAAFAFGVVFVTTLLVIAMRFENPSRFQYFVFRSVLALACSGVATVLPGLLEIRVKGWLKAGGALAVLALVYWFTPVDLVAEPRLGTDTSNILREGDHVSFPLTLEGPRAVYWNTDKNPFYTINPREGYLEPWQAVTMRVEFHQPLPAWQKWIFVSYGESMDSLEHQLRVPLSILRPRQFEKKFSISGSVQDCDTPNEFLPGTEVRLVSGEIDRLTQAGDQGQFILGDLEGSRDYEVSWKHVGYSFPSRYFRALDTRKELVVCGTKKETYMISGYVRGCSSGTEPLPGVLVRAQGPSTSESLTDSSGFYRIGGLPAGGNYEITSELAGYSFPVRRSFRRLSDHENFDFCGTTEGLGLGVAVHERRGKPVEGVAISIMIEGDPVARGNWPRTAMTGSNGNIFFGDLLPGRNYSVAASSSLYSFEPSVIKLTNFSSSQTINFRAMLSSVGVVRWHGEETEIQAQVAARVQTSVMKGSKVKPGDLLVQLNCSSYEHELSFWNEAAEDARKNLDSYVNQNGREKLPEFQQVKAAQAEAVKVKRLWEAEIVSKARMDQATLAVDVAQSVLDQADTQRTQELQNSLQDAKRQRSVAEQNIKDCSYTSNLHGIVVWAAGVDKYVPFGGTLLRIVETDRPRVVVMLDESLEDHLEKGRSVEIVAGKKRYHGRISSMSENREVGSLQIVVDFTESRLSDAEIGSLIEKRVRVLL